MCYGVFVFVQVILQISKILNDFMFYFPINTVSLDKRKLGLVSLLIEAFLKVQKITSLRVLYHCFT